MPINIDRLMNDVNALGKIGFEEGVGTTRAAYSKSFNEGRRFVEKLMIKAGLKTHIDGVGNLTGYLEGRCGGKIISMGSHIDTVQGGGMYDGALGVLSAIEIIRVMKEEGYSNIHPIEVIAFNEEEGNVIGGTFGSMAFTGTHIDTNTVSRMKALGITENDLKEAKRKAENYRCYIELHIEQGGCLESEGIDIGVVSGIVGILRYRATVKGRSNHSGSTPMKLRDDALEKTCHIITDLMEAVRYSGDIIVCTVGTMKVFPGEVNVIPGNTEFIIEMRDVNLENIQQVMKKILSKWSEKGLSVEEYIKQKETLCDSLLMKVIEENAANAGYSSKIMMSGAGHDLMNMVGFTPSSLIFIPSHEGISHSIMEYSKKEDIYRGTSLLYDTVKQVDKEGELYEN